MSSIWNTTESLLLGSSTPPRTESAITNPTSMNQECAEDVNNISCTSSGQKNDTLSLSQSLSNASDSSNISGWWKSGPERVVGRGRGSSLPPAVTEGLARHKAHEQQIYRHKYKLIKRMAKDLVLENTALCDLVAQVQQQVLLAVEENKFLLRKLSHYQTSPDNSHQLQQKVGSNVVQISAGMACEEANKSSGTVSSNSKYSKQIVKKKLHSHHGPKKRSRSSKPKILCPPITLDSAGRPIFPITLGPLTIHSLGDIVSERSAYHTESVIFPVGFCSSRMFASLVDPRQSALYTCKIMDGGSAPKFEIVCEEEEESIFTGDSPADCHGRILEAVNIALNMDLLTVRSDRPEANERGLRFFGLTHPSVQNVLQACPGARKCSKYKWVRFEICRSEAEVEKVFEAEKEASLCHEALLRNIRFAQHHISSC